MIQSQDQHYRGRAIIAGAAGSLVMAAFAGTATAQDIDMRLGLIYNPNVPVPRCGAFDMAEEPRLQDLGLNITVVHSAQLGGENDMAQQVSSGELEMSVSAASILAAWVEDLGVFETY